MILPNLDPWQKEFKETKGDKILCCGRQVGKTFICSINAAEWAVDPKNKGKNIIAALIAIVKISQNGILKLSLALNVGAG